MERTYPTPAIIGLVAVAALAALAFLSRAWLARHWRTVLPRLPLPMLALAASYGVFSFNSLFVPTWVALVSAAAFELTYVVIAAVATPDRRRATVIAVSAVAVSILYNTLAGLFHIRPALLVGRPLVADVALAVLHGLPLAVVAYNVAALLLHSQPTARPRLLAQRRALIRRLTGALRTSRSTAAQATERAAQLVAELAQLGTQQAAQGNATLGQLRERDQLVAQLHRELDAARAGQERAEADAAQEADAAAQLRVELAQAGELDVKALAQWAAALGAEKREIARQLRRPEATVRSWIGKAAPASMAD